MRTTTGAGYTIIYPEAVVYSTAGNYIRVQLDNAESVVVALKIGTATFAILRRFGADVVFPLDGIFSAAVGSRATRSTSGFDITVNNSVLTTGAINIVRAAMPYDSEFLIPSADAQFRAPQFFPIYPNLPQSVEFFAYSSAYRYITADGGPINYANVGWAKHHTTSSSIGSASELLIVDTPNSVNAVATLMLNRDECTDGYLISWLDSSGLRLSYRFPKGSHTFTSDVDGEYNRFDTLLRPVPIATRKAESRIVVSTALIGKAEREYVDGIGRGTDHTLLDLAEWSSNTNTQPRKVILLDGEWGNDSKPLQRREFQFKYAEPTL